MLCIQHDCKKMSSSIYFDKAVSAGGWRHVRS